MVLHDSDEFIRLSALANYVLDARPRSEERLAEFILGKADWKGRSERDRRVILDGLIYVVDAYGSMQRRLGPKAILHPLRTAALLCRSHDDLSSAHVVLALLHDKLEDVALELHPADTWQRLEAEFRDLMERLEWFTRWQPMEALETLARGKTQRYSVYLDQIVAGGRRTPELLSVKAADRLDNTLDLWLVPDDPKDEAGFFESAFRTLYLRGGPPMAGGAVFSTEPFSNARRLYELFKNVVFLSLTRTAGVARRDPVLASLVEALAQASLKEAQRSALHIFSNDQRSPAEQRQLLLEAMQYSQAGGIEAASEVDAGHRLDGLFLERFDQPDPELRHSRIDELEDDKDLLGVAAVAFVAIFQGFIWNPKFVVRGIPPEADRPVS